MKSKCQICGREYNPNDHATFFYLKYCSDACSDKADIEGRSQATGVHMYMCIVPLPIKMWNGKGAHKSAEVAEGTKWQRDDTQSNNLSEVHLKSLSGLANEEIGWLEISEQALKEHFQKV